MPDSEYSVVKSDAIKRFDCSENFSIDAFDNNTRLKN